MNPTILASLLASLCVVAASPSGKAEPAADSKELPPVPQLKSDTFDSFIKESQLAMVKFFAPWCGHCIKMADPYKLAGKTLKDQGVKAAVAEVDCTVEKDLCQKHHVTGYPALKVFKAGKEESILDYKGARDTDSIVEHLKRLSQPAVQVLKADEVKKHVSSFKKAPVIVANMPKGHAAQKIYEKVAEGLRENLSFALVEGKENTITIFKTFDEPEVKYGKPLDKLTEKDLAEWIENESIPLMDEISPNNYEKYISAKKPMAYLFYENDEQRKTYGEMVQKVMKPLKGTINAIFISVKDFGEHAKNLNLDQHWPGFVIHNIVDNLKYPLTGKDKPAPTLESVQTFVKNYVAGKLTPNYKSEPVPVDDKAHVKTIVHGNFEKLVLDPKKDALVEIYAPWCGACKRMAPELEKLAEAYSKHADKIVIGKMDGTENDLPVAAKFTLEQFPSLLFYKAGSNELVEMKSLGGLKELHEFIQASATNKLDVDISKYTGAPESAAAESEASDAGDVSEQATQDTQDENVEHEDL